MADLKRRVEAMEPGSEERKMGVSVINKPVSY
jgi:hypothetical protein